MTKKMRASAMVVSYVSGGMGQAAAKTFTEEGTSLALAARSKRSLEEGWQQRIVTSGGVALEVLTDGTAEEVVKALACKTIDYFGRVDAWANNAAVTLFGRSEEKSFGGSGVSVW